MEFTLKKQPFSEDQNFLTFLFRRIKIYFTFLFRRIKIFFTFLFGGSKFFLLFFFWRSKFSPFDKAPRILSLPSGGSPASNVRKNIYLHYGLILYKVKDDRKQKLYYNNNHILISNPKWTATSLCFYDLYILDKSCERTMLLVTTSQWH